MVYSIFRQLMVLGLMLAVFGLGAPALAQTDEPVRLSGHRFTDPPQAMPRRDDTEWLAMAPAGPDREALRIALKWHNAFFTGDREAIKSIAGDPLYLDAPGVELDQYLDSVMSKLCCVEKVEDRPFQIADIVIEPAQDPVTGEPRYSRGITGLNLGPNDRIVVLVAGVPGADGTLQPVEGIVHYIRYVPEGIYQIAGTWD